MHISSKFKNKFYYGWIIIFVAALSVFFSAPGQTYSVSAFIDSYIDEFNYSRTTVSTIYSIATVFSGSLLVFMGKAVDKYGQKKMTIIASILLAVTCIFNSFISNMVMLSFGFFFLRYFGQGSMTLIPGSLVPQWFEKRRALAISLTNIGGVLANTFVPIINVFLISRISWHFAWRFWALALMIIFVPMILVLLVNKPEDIGLLPDNRKVISKAEFDEELYQMEKESWTLIQALKTKEFWFVGFISMLAPMISTGLMFHYFSIMAIRGIENQAAAIIVGFIALPGFIMPIISGLIIDRLRSKHIITFTLMLISFGLIFFTITSSFITAAVFMLLYGLAINIQSVTLSVIWPRYFGRKYLGSIRGAATIFMVLGSALGPIPFGLSFDLTGNYKVVFIMMTIVTLLSIVMAISIKKPKKAL